MEQQELNRMFEGLAPTPEQERAMLDGLLREERMDRPMKRQMTKIAAAFVLAAAMLLTCAAAAVVTGIDQRFWVYFGLEAEQEPLLSRSAIPLDISVTNDGWTMEVKQVLADRYSLMMVVDFTAPEGTVLGEQEYILGPKNMNFSIPGQAPNSHSAQWQMLEDDDPADNHVSMLFTLDLGVEYRYLTGEHIDFSANTFRSYNGWVWEDVVAGDWSFSIDLPVQDSGRSYLKGEVFYLEGEPFTITSFYLSPISVGYEVEGQFDAISAPGKWGEDAANMTLKTKGGESIAISGTKFGELSNITQKGRIVFKPEQIIDPEDIVSITMYGQTFDLK